MYLWQQKSPALLGFYRPNQAMNRAYGTYPGLAGLGAPPVFTIPQLKRHLTGLGQDVAVDPKLLLGGIGLLAVGAFLFGAKKGPGLKRRRAARLRRRLAAIEG